MTEYTGRALKQGMTRDCVDPWEYVEFRPNGDIGPCCVRTIGNLKEQSVAQILTGKRARELRAALLSGQLDPTCRSCALKASIAPSGLLEKVRRRSQEVSLPANFNGDAYLDANPDVRDAKRDPAQHFLLQGRIEGRPLHLSPSYIEAKASATPTPETPGTETQIEKNTAPPNAVSTADAEYYGGSKVTSLKDLMALEGQAFVASAYMTILDREPDPVGMLNYVGELQSGTEKFTIVSRLRTSEEGKRLGRLLPGYRSEVVKRYWHSLFGRSS